MKLEPCPLCSGQAKLIDETGSWGYYPAVAYVKCSNCGTEGPSVNDDADPKYRQSAALLWNKRPTP